MSGVVVEPSALIHGRAALILATVLGGGLRSVPPLERLLGEMRLDPLSVESALEALRALEEAGQAWRGSRFPETGNPATRGNGRPADSVVMGVGEAARLLGRSERRVRQFAAAGDLPGVRTSRGWLFERGAVVGLRDRLGQEA